MKKKISNRILSLALVFIMVFGMLPALNTTVYAAASTPTIDNTGEGCIYANGTPITIEAGATGGTSVWYMNGGTKTYLVENADLSLYNIYGGTYETNLDSNTSVTMTGGTVEYLYGGSNYADINGNTYVHISGGTVTSYIYGAGAFKSSRITGTVTTVMTGGTAKKGVGGGSSVKGDSYTKYGFFTGGVPAYATSNIVVGPDSFTHLIYKSGSAWLVKGSPVVPAGITMTVASGETLTLDYGEKVINQGAIVNNGTIILKSKGLLGNAITGNGNIIRSVPYITADSVSSLTVWRNGTQMTVGENDYEIFDGKLYLYVPTGNLMVKLNGEDYCGTYSGDALELQKYVAVESLNVTPTQMEARTEYRLAVTYTEGALTQTVAYEIIDAGTTGATLNGNKLLPKFGGTLTLKTTLSDGYYTYSDTAVITVTQKQVTGIDGTVSKEAYAGFDVYLPTAVTPSDATYRDIVWTVSDAGETGATLNGNVLRAAKSGKLKVKATVVNGVGNGQDFTKEYEINVNALTTGYVEYSWNGTAAVPTPKSMPNVYTGVDTTKTTWSDGWYVVNNNVTIGSRITVTGTVNLILVDGATLTASKGISVNSGNTLNIFGQQQSTGKLIATNDDTNNSTIGGDKESVGTINIHGGTISATKSLYNNKRTYGAAIGGGGKITIYAGTVEATSDADGAAIGGRFSAGADVTIYGGAVTATSNDSGAAIGSGLYGSSDNSISIHGGTVVAKIGKADNQVGAAIGGGQNAKGSNIITITGGNVIAAGNGTSSGSNKGGSAGIGGGYGSGSGSAGGTITISGGNVTATGGYGSAGIGGGFYGVFDSITVSGGIINATGGELGAGIGGGGNKPANTITVTGGTITATGGKQAAGIGGGSGKSGGTITVTGGNIKAIAGSGAEAIGKGKGSTTSGTLTNADDSPLTLNTITLNGAAADTAVTVTNGITYGLNDVKTLDTNKLYFYLPENTVATSITAGGAEYFCKDKNSLNYYTSHDWSNKDGVCIHCGEICEHEGQESTCSICGTNLHDHEWEYTVSGTTVTANCKNTDNNCPNTAGGSVTLAKPDDLTYTGSNIEAVVTDSLTTGDTVKVEYYGNTTGGYPVNVGEYTAILTVDGNEVSVIYEITAASIENADVSASDAVYTGKAQKPAVTVKLDGKTLTEGTDYTVEYSNNTAVGKATVTVTGKGNYAKTAKGSFEIAYLTGAPDAAVSGTKGENGWYTSEVTLAVPDGYTISKTVDGAYGETLTFASEQNETVTYYLKDDASGKIAEKTVELKIDLTDPTAEYAINDNGWREFINFITFGIFCKDNADLSITASDTMDESVTVQYVVSAEKLTATEITDWNNYSNKVNLNPKAKNYIYIKVTDDAGNTVIYESGVVVFSDSTESVQIEYTKHSTEDVTAQIEFNGNTVKEVKYAGAALSTDSYTVTESGIQFKADYLNTLAASDTPYTFTVSYNPMGESWTESADSIANDTVGTTTIDLTVKKATLTISGAALKDKTYDGSANGTVTGVTFTETDKLALGTDYTATVVYDSENAGNRTATVTVTLLNTDKANAYALTSTTYTLDATIGKAAAPELTNVEATYKFTITGFDADVSNVGMPTDAGTITYAKGTASVDGNATVTAWSVNENGKVTATISGGAKQDVITLPVTVSSDNYEDAVVNVVVTLGNRPEQSALTVKADSSVTYGNKLTLSTEGGSGTGDVTYSIVSGGENATIEGNVLTATKVGTVVITATKAGDNDYEPTTSVQFTIEVTKRELTPASATATDRDYNGTANVMISGIALDNIYTNDDVSVTFNTTGTVGSANKGEYTEVTVSGLALTGYDAANYKLSESADGKYTVSTEVEISALDISGAEITLGNALTYNGSEQTQTVTGVTKNGLTVTYTVSDNKATNHGNYDLTVTGTDNFTGTQTKAWSITKRPITVTATAQTITYGENITADAYTSTNVVDGHKLNVTLTPSTGDVTVTGTIAVTVNDITADGKSVIGNYDVSVSSGKLTIQPELSSISDLTTDNVTSADKADIEAVKEMMAKADYDNADGETKKAWDTIVENCDTLLERIKAVADEITRVTEKTGSYDADTVNSDDTEDLNKLAADIKALTNSNNLTEKERTDLTALAETVTTLQKIIADTVAENKRIAEELDKFDKDTVNSDDSDELTQLLTDIEKQLTSTNLTDEEKQALEDAKTAVTDMQKVIADTVAENNRISDEVDKYSIDTVKSSDEEALNTLLDEINEQLTSTHLTDAEISELNGDKTAVEDLLAKIKGTDELIDKLTGDVDSYNDETVKSTDKEAIEQLIEDIDALLETENLTEDEEKALEDSKTKAEGLLDTIEDAAKATDTENTEKVKDVTADNVTPEDKTDLENAKADLEKALEENVGNYTEDEKKAIQDEIDRIDDALEIIENVEAVEDEIGNLPENITKDDKAAIKAADDAYNALTDYEKSLVDEKAKKALDDAKAALAELNKPADSTSPSTGDNKNLWLWVALLFVSGAGIFGIALSIRKRRMISKR